MSKPSNTFRTLMLLTIAAAEDEGNAGTSIRLKELYAELFGEIR